MRNFKNLMRFFRLLLFAFMLAVCMVMGIAPVIPKRKEQFAVEIKMQETTKEDGTILSIDVKAKN
jgi:type IV secretory pathway component VirB8